MKLLSVNAGSSSLKFTMYEMPQETIITTGVFERIGIDGGTYTIKINGEKVKKDVNIKDHEEAVKILVSELINHGVIKDVNEIEGVGHRTVHGADKYSDSIIINEEVIKDIESFIPLAPLHNPANLIGITSFKHILPNVKMVAVFDTAYHQTMDAAHYLYPVPYEWYEKYAVRKYGFHGTSHKYINHRIMEIENDKDLKVIVCHLGNGASISASIGGHCIDTSMGFTPLPGVMMGTRSGDVDPSIIPYVMKNTGMNVDEVIDALNKKSGLLGVSGVSSDSRDIEEGIKNNNERCLLAQTIFVNKVVNYISMYNTELNKADVICFTAGIGENGIDVRAQIMNKLSALNIKLDETANDVRSKLTLISTADSAIKCYIVPTDEELMIARDTYELIK